MASSAVKKLLKLCNVMRGLYPRSFMVLKSINLDVYDFTVCDCRISTKVNMFTGVNVQNETEFAHYIVCNKKNLAGR